jgi:hypothetical protein
MLRFVAALLLSPVTVFSGLYAADIVHDDTEWGEPADGQSISIKTTKSAFGPEEKISLSITFKNRSTHPVKMQFTGNIFGTYEFSVEYEDGKATPQTALGKALASDPNKGYMASREMEVGEECTRDVPLSRYFDFRTCFEIA